MNRKLPFIITFTLLCSNEFSLIAQSRKRALLVGVGEYTAAEYAGKPLNALKGVQLMRSTLQEKGFYNDDIVALTNADATLDGMDRAFKRYLLQVAPGDAAVFYFYGHGSQIQDDNDDEADKLDEALVPYDGHRNSAKDHRNLLSDDVLARWIEALRRRAGPSGQVLVLLDACHSGSGLRGAAGNKAKPDKHHLAGIGNEDTLAPLVAFYSSLPHQPSIEITVGGNEHCALFTWAFCKAMQQLDTAGTYRGLFEQTALLMAAGRNQIPQLEGARDRRIFGGKVASPRPYFKATAAFDEREFLLAAGLLHGLHAGTRVVVYPPETRDTTRATPIAWGIVPETGAGLLECTVALDRPVPEEQLLSAWVFVAERRFSRYSLPLRLDVADAEQKSALRNRLAGMEALKLDAVDAPELTLLFDKGKLVLQSADGALVWEARYNPARPEPTLLELQKALGDYLQAQFLRTLAFENSPYQAGFTAQIGKTANGPPGFDSGLIVRQHKDTVLLKVINRSAKPVYYTLLDIDARNVVQVLLPGPGRTPGEYRLEPDAESPFHRVRFDAPGREVLKLIVTPVPIDLREAMASRGRSTGSHSFFENLFAESYWLGAKSRGPSGTYRGNEAGVETLVLQVIK